MAGQFANSTALVASPYRDPNAGGYIPGCGSGSSKDEIARWGNQFTRYYDQYCASCPPCTTDRFPVRIAARERGLPCCNSEYGEIYDARAWPFVPVRLAQPADVRPRFRELYNSYTDW